MEANRISDWIRHAVMILREYPQLLQAESHNEINTLVSKQVSPVKRLNARQGPSLSIEQAQQEAGITFSESLRADIQR